MMDSYYSTSTEPYDQPDSFTDPSHHSNFTSSLVGSQWVGYPPDASYCTSSTRSNSIGQEETDGQDAMWLDQDPQFSSFVGEDVFTSEPSEIAQAHSPPDHPQGVLNTNGEQEYIYAETKIEFAGTAGDTLEFSYDRYTLPACPVRAGLYNNGPRLAPPSRDEVAPGWGLPGVAAKPHPLPVTVHHGGHTHRGDSEGPSTGHLPLPSAANPLLLTASNRWAIPQLYYQGNGSSRHTFSQNVPFMRVGVAVCHALHPETLVQILEDPLGAGFPPERGASRKGKKLTFRNVFCFDGGNVSQNENPKQIHEYASRHQSSPSAKLAWESLDKPQRKDSESVPLMRVTLVEKAAQHLQTFMADLERKGTPLTFRGHQVHYAHLWIVELIRPTPATVQPLVEILPEFRDYYEKTL